MRDFARLPSADRAALFQTAGQQSGLPVNIIEKDFWVCWMLDRLWSASFAPHLIFKGGTSLSKCFGLIQRFSEDIDIGLDRAMLGFDGENDPTAPNLSRSARTKRVESLKEAAKAWIETEFLNELTETISAELGDEVSAGWSWQTEYDTDGMPKLRWNPPQLESKRRRKTQVDANDYLNRGVMIEIGSRAAHWPASWHTVTPYVAEQFPVAFSAPPTQICALDVARTFWEKATILHILYRETQSDLEAGKPARERERYSRHCYDLHCIATSAAGKSAAQDFDLLADVVAFKRVFFCSSKAKEAQYEDAQSGTLHLVPHPTLNQFFDADYAKMQSSGMFFGAPPSWDEIRQTLQETEDRINGAQNPN